MLKRLHYGIIIFSAFALVFICSQRFYYVEGDDASSVAYHAFGRNAEIQPPYNPYHGMMDLFLSVLPAHEPTLRTAIFVIAILSAAFFYFMLMRLMFQVLRIEDNYIRLLITVLGLMVMPEYLFLGLSYVPTVTAMCFILSAHYYLRRKMGYQGEHQRPLLFKHILIASVIFGFGTSCRWDTVIYGGIIFVDIAGAIYVRYKGSARNRQLGMAFLWGAFALVFFYVFIYLTGYDLDDMAKVLRMLGMHLPHHFKSLPLIIAYYQNFFTSVTALLIVWGLVAWFRTRSPLVLPFVAAVLLALPFLPAGYIKPILYAVPMFMLAFGQGVKELVQISTTNASRSRYAVMAVLLIAAVPWFIGLKMPYDSSWGPGFEVLTPLERQEKKISKPTPAFAGGIAIPMQDGMRPLYGYGHVLLGGEWPRLLKKRHDELSSAIATAISDNIPLLEDDRKNIVFTALAREGYTSREPRITDPLHVFSVRSFVNNMNDTVKVVLLRNNNGIFDADVMAEVADSLKTETAFLFSGYTQTINTIYKHYKTAGSRYGPFSVLIDLKELAAQISTSPIEVERKY